MQLRYTPKSVITLALCALLAPSLAAQHSLAISELVNNAGTHWSSAQFGGVPVNDDCSGATIVPLAVGSPEVRTGDNTGATDSYGFGNEVWEAFTLTECADVLVEYCGTTPAFTGIPLPSLFIGCPLTNLVWIGGEDVVICGDGNFGFNYVQLPPGTYYLPVYQTVGATGPYQLTLTATACSGTPPVNDDCSGAVTLTANPSCAPVDGDVANANISGGSIAGNGCSNGDPSEDVWYSFVATATEHTIIVDPSDQLSVVIELHADDCTGLNLVNCLEGENFGTLEQMDATGLTIGTTYYVRIYDWYAGTPNSTAFTICLLGPGGCTADAGTLTATDDEVCFDGVQADIEAQPNGDAVVPTGYSAFYLLSTEPGGVIWQLSASPLFTVTALGSYGIHTLVIDTLTFDTTSIDFGVSTIADVNALLVPGGGTICGSVDEPGAAIDVIDCPACDAVAGTLTPDETEVCLVDGSATISATPDGNSTVPSGFTTAYLLSLAPTAVVMDGSLTPDFTVTEAGIYAIHTLVYDPNTLDLGSIQIGSTTIAEIDTALIQGGGGICASLDLTEAAITVTNCVSCEANAGSLAADLTPVCLLADSASISATPGGNSVVPTGYETVYVLSQGAGLVIIDLNASPAFTVMSAGTYTIHTLVHDPLSLDIDTVELGITTIAGLDTLLIQGGGTICAALDTTGATFEVEDCAPMNDDCANATPLSIEATDDCPANAVSGNNTYATQDGGEPGCDVGSTAGYIDVWYTFDSGNNTTVTINLDQGTMEDWAITVSEGCGGTEVYCEVNPAAPIDLATMLNTTYVVRVYSNLDFGGGGEFTICVSADEPAVACDGGEVETGDAQTSVTVCQDATADVIPFVTSSTSTENYSFILTDTDGVIVALLVGNSLDFNSAPLGTYQVWGVSYNGDLENAVPDASIDTLSSTGACLDLSSNSVEVIVEICDGISENTAAGWSLFPNPGNGDATLTYSGRDAMTTIEVIDTRGRIVHQERAMMVHGQRQALPLGGRLEQGVYSIRLTNEGGSAILRMTVR